MAIYYIDPHTTTNGTGTWASPWSLNSATRTGLASGDEIRIKGVALTSLLLATSYTATVTNHYRLTITAGGGLGADWALYDVAYIVEWDAFFKVTYKSGNIIGLAASTQYLPILDTSITTVTLQKLDTTTYPVSTTGSQYSVINSAAYTNITVSDCWTDATTRVTDGSVRTIFNSSYTSTQTCNLTNSSLTNSNLTFNLQNTHILHGNTAPYAYTTIPLYGKIITVNLKQLASTGYQYDSNGGAGFGGAVYDSTIYVPLLGGNLAGNFFGNNTTFTADYVYVYQIGTMFFGSPSSGINYASNLTFNLTNISFAVTESWGNSLLTCIATNGVTINYNGLVECFNNTQLQGLLFAYGPINMNFGAGFQYKYNKRVSTQTSVIRKWYGYGTPGPSNSQGGTIYLQTPALPTGWTSTYDVYFSALPGASFQPGSLFPKQPTQITYNLPRPNQYTNEYFRLNTNGQSNLYVYRNGTAPEELIAPNTGYPNTVSTFSEAVKVTTDATVFRTTGPSLKAYLGSRNTSYWLSQSTKAYKTIKIPVTAGTSYTVSGYIRCDDTAYTNGDCTVSVVSNGIDLATQSMTTACINAWQQFTLTFTATETAEVLFSWGMYYANGAKSYWLDDLTIA